MIGGGGRRTVSSEIQKLLAELVTEEGIRLPARRQNFKEIARKKRIAINTLLYSV